MADSNRLEGNRVFCHQCHNRWNRAEGGLTCPRCQGEFTEFEPPSTEDASQWGRDSPGSPNHDHELHDHYPFENIGRSARPGNNDPATYHWQSPFGNGGSSFSVSIRRGGFPGGAVDRSTEHDFFDMMNLMMGGRRGSSPGAGPGIGLPGGPPRQFPGFAVSPGLWPPGSPNRRNGQHDDEMPRGDIFSMMFDQRHGPQQNRGGPTPNSPPHPLAQLLGILLPGNMPGSHGDYVFNREDLDRVMSQIMEQNPSSNAPPPATDAAINALSKKTITKDMLDDAGKAECTICMENADIGTEVTVLPCTHWFHHECIKPWLQQNQTCPHCRKGVQQWFEENSNQQPSSSHRTQSEPGRSRRSSHSIRLDRLSPSGSEHPEGSRSNPVLIPSSPLQRHRQMPGSFGDESLSPASEALPHLRSISRPYAITPSPRPSTSRRESGRSGSHRSRRNSSGGGEGGVSGWFRDHNPFR